MAAAPRPIELDHAFSTLEAITANIRIKNTTMINYYIHPDPVPSQINEFAPRIEALAERIADNKSVATPNTTLLLDSAQVVLASYLVPIAQQLSASVDQFQLLFIEYYDRSLSERTPYLQLFQRLGQLQVDLKQFMEFHMGGPNRRPAAQLLPPPSTVAPSWCPAAVAFINNRDTGRIHQCMPTELTAENRVTLRAESGMFVWWECTQCAFRLRFHITNSAAMSINSTNEVRRHDGITDLAYRSSWLAKCHLYHPGRDEQVQERERRRAAAYGSSAVPKSKVPINTFGIGGVKFGCPFCFAKGKSLVPGETAFAKAVDYAQHISSSHAAGLPAPILLQTLKVGIKDRLPPKVNRWDLNMGAT